MPELLQSFEKGGSHHVCFPNTRLLFYLPTSRLAVSLPAVPENGFRRAKLEPLFHQSQVLRP